MPSGVFRRLTSPYTVSVRCRMCGTLIDAAMPPSMKLRNGAHIRVAKIPWISAVAGRAEEWAASRDWAP